VQVKIFSHATEGTAEVWVNGASLGSATGLNTGGADITSVQFASGGASSTARWDNLYISDEIEGELVSVLCKPSSDDATQFTPSAGTDNYAMVDDTAQDGDTTYVASGTVGHKDLYGYEDVPSGYLVKAASLVTIGRKDDSGTRTLQPLSVQGVTERDVGAEIGLSETYPAGVGAGVLTTLGEAPDGTAWDRAKFNAVKWGFEVAS
jgi:hypothetical protein